MELNSDSRTKNASRNVMSALVNKICILMLTFISRKFFIQYIGVEYLGINGLFSNILTLLSLADLGLGTAMNVSLYKPIAEDDTRKLSALLNYFRKLYYVIAVAVFVIGMSLLPFLKYIVNMDRNIPYLKLYYTVFVIKNSVSYLFVYKSSIIRADQRNYLVNRIDIFVNIGRVILQLISIVKLRSYLVYILLEVLQVIVNNLVISWIADKNYPFIKNKGELNTSERKDIFRNVSSVFLYKLSWTLLNGTDNILMSVIVGTVSVGLYSNYLTITGTIESFVGLLFTSLTASIGNLVASSAPESRYKIYKMLQMVSFWMCSYICVSLVFLTQDFVYIWLGNEFQLDNVTLVAIILNTYFSICMRPIWTFREGTGMYYQIRYIMFVTAVLNLILSIILGCWMGISGIIFATSISKLLTYFWYEPNILFKKFFNRSVKEYYISYVINIVLIFICMGICYIPICFMKRINMVVWFLKAIICFGVVNMVYVLKYCKSDEMKNIILRVRQMNYL